MGIRELELDDLKGLSNPNHPMIRRSYAVEKEPGNTIKENSTLIIVMVVLLITQLCS